MYFIEFNPNKIHAQYEIMAEIWSNQLMIPTEIGEQPCPKS